MLGAILAVCLLAGGSVADVPMDLCGGDAMTTQPDCSALEAAFNAENNKLKAADNARRAAQAAVRSATGALTTAQSRVLTAQVLLNTCNNNPPPEGCSAQEAELTAAQEAYSVAQTQYHSVIDGLIATENAAEAAYDAQLPVTTAAYNAWQECEDDEGCPDGQVYNSETGMCEDDEGCTYRVRNESDVEVSHPRRIRVAPATSSRFVDADGETRYDFGDQHHFPASGSPAVEVGTDAGNGYVDVYVADPTPTNPLYGTLYLREVSLFQEGERLELVELEARNEESIAIHGERELDLGESSLDETATQALLDEIVARFGVAVPVIRAEMDVVNSDDALVYLMDVHDPVEIEGVRHRIGYIQHRWSVGQIPQTTVIFEPDR